MRIHNGAVRRSTAAATTGGGGGGVVVVVGGGGGVDVCRCKRVVEEKEGKGGLKGRSKEDG